MLLAMGYEAKSIASVMGLIIYLSSSDGLLAFKEVYDQYLVDSSIQVRHIANPDQNVMIPDIKELNQIFVTLVKATGVMELAAIRDINHACILVEIAVSCKALREYLSNNQVDEGRVAGEANAFLAHFPDSELAEEPSVLLVAIASFGSAPFTPQQAINTYPAHRPRMCNARNLQIVV